MTKKEATEGILRRLATPLGKRGFSLLKTKAWFVGSDSKGFLPIFSFQLISIEQNGVEFRPQASIRVVAIETIMALAKQTPAAQNKNSVTLGSELGRLTGDVHRWRIEVRTEAELDDAAGLLVQAVDEAETAVFTKYDNLPAIDEHLNAAPAKLAVLSPLPVPRAELGIVVARLLQRTDVPGLIDSHRAFLGTISKHDVKDFDDFLAQLDRAIATSTKEKD